MKLVGITFVFLCSSLAFGFVLPAKKFATANDSNLAAESKTNCVNFSGNWKGTCTEESEDGVTVEEDVTVIKQEGCDSIELDGELYYLSGSKTTTDTTHYWTSTLTMFLDWNTDKTELKGLFNWFWRTLLPGSNQSTSTVNASGDLAAKLDGKKLTTVSNFSSTGFSSDGTEERTSDKTTCTYEKQ